MKIDKQEFIREVIAAVREEDSKVVQKAEKKEKDRRLRNTKLLLQNYPSFKRYAEEHEKSPAENLTPISELILNEQDIVTSIRMTTERTITMVEHMDKALKALHFICEQEQQTTHYDVLEKRYIQQKAIEDIADEYMINPRTVYKQLTAATEQLSLLLFGVYGLKTGENV